MSDAVTDRLRVLGIDPGSRLTGFGIIDFANDRPHYVASGTVMSIDGSFSDRLRKIFDAVGDLMLEYQPEVIAIESIFVHRNAGSALKLGHARAAAICATFANDAKVHEYAPREIKQAIVGTGSASKEQVQHMVMSLLQLKGKPAPDAADALAAALCHGYRRRLQNRLGELNGDR